VIQVIEYSQDILEPKIDELIDNWLENKSWLIEKLGGLIYEVPEKISIDLDENEKNTYEDFGYWCRQIPK
jgi:hypothetical protein